MAVIAGSEVTGVVAVVAMEDACADAATAVTEAAAAETALLAA